MTCGRASSVGVDMRPEILDKQGGLAGLCRKHSVRRLELFGSAARGDFDVATSDLDFLVEFLPLESGEHFDAYFGLLEDLESLF